jgi:hypothetical protein
VKNLITAEERIRLQSSVIPVYRRYPGQWRPQPAYIVIDPERGQVYADYSGELGNAVTAYYWHRREEHISLQAGAYGPDIVQFIEDHEDEIRRIIESYRCVWDGNNHVGRWGRIDLLHRLERAAQDEIRVVHVMDHPAELGIDGEITADTDPAELAAEIWVQIPAAPHPDYDWVPAFSCDDLEEYIGRRVAELQAVGQ